MKKALWIAALALCSVSGAWAQVGKAAAETQEAVQQKVEEHKAENAARNSGPVGKAVNKTKAKYHKARAKHASNKAKHSLEKAVN